MRIIVAIAVVAVAGCQPAAPKAEPPRSPWVITEVHHYDIPVPTPPKIDLPPAKPVKTIIDILDESPSATRTPPAKAKPAPLPAADAPTVDGNYYEAPRRRGIFRRSGSTNNGSAAAFC